MKSRAAINDELVHCPGTSHRRRSVWSEKGYEHPSIPHTQSPRNSKNSSSRDTLSYLIFPASPYSHSMDEGEPFPPVRRTHDYNPPKLAPTARHFLPLCCISSKCHTWRAGPIIEDLLVVREPLVIDRGFVTGCRKFKSMPCLAVKAVSTRIWRVNLLSRSVNRMLNL
jgi:hypothetical protein